MFLANYADVLTDAPLDRHGRTFPRQRTPWPRCWPCPRRRSSTSSTSTRATASTRSTRSPTWACGRTAGYFVLRPEVHRPHPRGRRPRRRRLHGPGEGGPPAGLPLRRLLAARRHAQGAQRPRGRLPGRHASLDALGAPEPRAHRRWRASWRASSSGVTARVAASAVMRALLPEALDELVLLAAHCDDIPLGAGGTILTLCRARPGLRVRALVLSGGGTPREDEERAALAAFCPGADLAVTVRDMPDGRLPHHWQWAKEALEEFRRDLRARPRARRAPRRRPPGPPRPRPSRPDGLPRPPGAGLRDPQSRARPRPAAPAVAPGARGRRGEEPPAPRALPVPGLPRLVRRRGLLGPRPHPRGAGRGALRGGLPPDAGAARAPPYRHADALARISQKEGRPPCACCSPATRATSGR